MAGTAVRRRVVERQETDVHRFKVHLREFCCENLVVDEDPCEAFLHLEFGGRNKVWETDREPNTTSPEWGFKQAFHYALSSVQQLSRLHFRVSCMNKANNKLIGRASVSLHTIACGPEHCQLTLLDECSEPRGTLRFTCVMKMLSSNLQATCSDLSLVMQGYNAPATLKITSSLASTAKSVSQEYSAEGCWKGPFNFVYETTLKDMLRYDETRSEHLHFAFSDEGGTEQGEAFLEFRKNLPHVRDRDQSVSFKLPVTYKGRADEAEAFGNVGELEGSILYQNLPIFAQMVGGLWVDDHVEGGHLFAEGVPHPPCSDPPSVWQERPHFELLNDDEEDGTGEDEHFDDKHLSELLMMIDLPPPWEKRRERAGGRTYFFDPRSRRMTWKDPRFLPENWDQRVDPSNGRVYYQYHKTKGTTLVDPRCCPQGWDMRLANNGEIYFAYLPAMQTTFTDPRGLPEAVDPALDDVGRIYFKQNEDKVTTWEDPREGQKEVVLAHWRHEEFVRWIREQVRMEMKERHEQAVHEDSEDD